MILVIDNYDSFTYNLVQMIAGTGHEVEVLHNDSISPKLLRDFRPESVIISPGPGSPKDSGISMDAIRMFSGKIPVLGVCLGHQCIAAVFGGKVVKAARPCHGKVSEVFHDGKTIFKGLPMPFQATRYHSLAVDGKGLPGCLEVSAWTKDGVIMGIRHREIPSLEGVQFHPESIMTKFGARLVQNFLFGKSN